MSGLTWINTGEVGPGNIFENGRTLAFFLWETGPDDE